jgi:hypothetical protein
VRPISPEPRYLRYPYVIYHIRDGGGGVMWGADASAQLWNASDCSNMSHRNRSTRGCRGLGPLGTVLPEKLMVVQLVKKFPGLRDVCKCPPLNHIPWLLTFQ